jgi:hypothetical protein
MPQILKPGESLHLEVCVPPQFDSWYITPVCTEWGLTARAQDWAWRHENAKAKRWISRYLPKIKGSSITYGPITNQPPSSLSPAAMPVSNSTKAE